MEMDLLKWLLSNGDSISGNVFLLITLIAFYLLYSKYKRYDSTRYAKLTNTVNDLTEEVKDIVLTVKDLSKSVSELVSSTKVLANDQIHANESIRKLEIKVFK